MRPRSFDILGDITDVETIAVGRSIRELDYLNRKYGRGRWRKCKGVALICYKKSGRVVKAEIHFVKCIANQGDSLSLTPGQFYRVLPDKAEVHGMLRVVDNTGEDYLFDADLFEEVNDLSDWLADLTVSVTVPMKASIRQIANQRGISMAALVREWIDERLDLPVTAR